MDARPENLADIRRRYAALRAGLPDGARVTVLHIGADETTVASGDRAEPDAVQTLAIGSRRTAADFFRHNPPTAIELENAIQAVEDEVVRARDAGTDGAQLITADAGLQQIARLAGMPQASEIALDREAVERVFARMAAVTLGRPAAQEGIPADAAFAATLLILREFMHHLKFAAMTIKT